MTGYALSDNVEANVVRLLYQQAAELNWTHLKDEDRTKHYQRWTEDPAIGGRLMLFVGRPENVRPWIKDGPMKEYVRATYGVGKYAQYVTQPAVPIDALVSKALGAGWIVDPDTLRIKPLSVVIRRQDDEEHESRFAWGPAFKHLAWAAIKSQESGDARQWVACVVDSFVKPITSTEKALNLRIGRRLNIAVAHVTVD